MVLRSEIQSARKPGNHRVVHGEIRRGFELVFGPGRFDVLGRIQRHTFKFRVLQNMRKLKHE